MIFVPPLHLPVPPMHLQDFYEDLMGDNIKGIIEVQVEIIHCFPINSQTSHLIVEVQQVSKEGPLLVELIPFGELM